MKQPVASAVISGIEGDMGAVGVHYCKMTNRNCFTLLCCILSLNHYFLLGNFSLIRPTPTPLCLRAHFLPERSKKSAILHLHEDKTQALKVRKIPV